MVEELFSTLEPVVTAADLELVDVEFRSGVLLVTVDRASGVDLEALTDANRAVSSVLDELDPIPGRYTLEVSSPGLERRLRTPAHFARAVGETVTVRTLPDTAALRRVRGVLGAADETGFVIESAEVPDGSIRIAYDQIERARTVFEWGPGPAPDRGAKAERGRKQQERERSRS